MCVAANVVIWAPFADTSLPTLPPRTNPVLTQEDSDSVQAQAIRHRGFQERLESSRHILGLRIADSPVRRRLQ